MPSCEEVNDILDRKYGFTLPSEDIVKARYVSIDTLYNNDNRFGDRYTTLKEYNAKTSTSPINDIMDRSENRNTVERLLSKLSGKESQVLRMLYGIGMEEMTINNVSEVIGLSGERVRQIKNEAVTKLRAFVVNAKK